MAAILDEHATVATIEGRFTLAQLVLGELDPLHAVLAAQAPGQRLGFEVGAVGEDVELAVALDQRSDTGFVGQASMPLGGVCQQRAQRARGRWRRAPRSLRREGSAQATAQDAADNASVWSAVRADRRASPGHCARCRGATAAPPSSG